MRTEDPQNPSRNHVPSSFGHSLTQRTGPTDALEWTKMEEKYWERQFHMEKFRNWIIWNNISLEHNAKLSVRFFHSFENQCVMLCDCVHIQVDYKKLVENENKSHIYLIQKMSKSMYILKMHSLATKAHRMVVYKDFTCFVP